MKVTRAGGRYRGPVPFSLLPLLLLLLPVSSIHMDAWELFCGLVGGKNTCAYKCPAGQVRRPTPGFQPRPNGCGTEGMEVNLTRFNFQPCCLHHDRCYTSCTLDKKGCDSAFFACMKAQCDIEATGSPSEMRRCIHDARLYHAAVYGFGCGPYRNAQKKACQCQPDEEEEAELEGDDDDSAPMTGRVSAAAAAREFELRFYSTPTTAPENLTAVVESNAGAMWERKESSSGAASNATATEHTAASPLGDDSSFTATTMAAARKSLLQESLVIYR